jgi:hypothetical protein
MVDGANGRAVIVCADASGPQWQLGPLPPADGAFALIGWTFEDTDGGVPSPVVQTIARALVTYGRVTFPSASVPVTEARAWSAWHHDFTTTMQLTARGARVRELFRSRRVSLLSTSREESARRLFDDPFYQWWNQAQFALLSRPAERPPNILEEPALGSDLFDSRWSAAITDLKRRGVDAILRPGVDGDVMGVLCSSRDVRSEVEEMVGLAATDFQLAFRRVAEEEFASLLSTRADDSPGPQ